jgi:hypothetical protein
MNRSLADLVVWCIKLSDLRHHASMGDRYRTPDGWVVEVIELSATPDRNDGERFKVTYYGFFVALVSTVAELEQWLALSDLEPETLILRRKCAGWPGPVGTGRGKRSRGRSRTRPGTADRLTDRRVRSRPSRAELNTVTDARPQLALNHRLPCLNSGSSKLPT